MRSKRQTVLTGFPSVQRASEYQRRGSNKAMTKARTQRDQGRPAHERARSGPDMQWWLLPSAAFEHSHSGAFDHTVMLARVTRGDGQAKKLAE